METSIFAGGREVSTRRSPLTVRDRATSRSDGVRRGRREASEIDRAGQRIVVLASREESGEPHRGDRVVRVFGEEGLRSATLARTVRGRRPRPVLPPAVARRVDGELKRWRATGALASEGCAGERRVRWRGQLRWRASIPATFRGRARPGSWCLRACRSCRRRRGRRRWVRSGRGSVRRWRRRRRWRRLRVAGCVRGRRRRRPRP